MINDKVALRLIKDAIIEAVLDDLNYPESERCEYPSHTTIDKAVRYILWKQVNPLYICTGQVDSINMVFDDTQVVVRPTGEAEVYEC